LELNRAFWHGRRVFVTGHTGFKGSWLVLWLRHLGARVTGYAIDVPTTPSLYEMANVEQEIENIVGDVRNLSALTDAMRRARPEIAFHLAAQPLVRRSYDEPVETFATNVLGTVNVLEAARVLDTLRSLVVVTSDKCYRHSEVAHTEDDPLGGDDPYSASKAAAELATAAYRRAFFADRRAAIATVRAGNVIGGGDFARDRLVPDVMRAAASGKTAVIRNPEHVRPWQHVLDPLAGYLVLAERLDADESLAAAWNFGPLETEGRSVRWLVGALVERWAGQISIDVDERGGDGREAGALRLDASRARRVLDWQPAWDIDRGLDATVELYEAFADGSDVRRLAVAQIERYEADARA
jgi:CDP-glucose 4,6-dehydratase